jgi:hypothetical protein
MSRWNWTKWSHGWHAGSYQIELAAPGLWVCSRKGRDPDELPTIVMTSGSLRALKARVERAEVKRRLARRSWRYLAALVLSVTVVAFASFSSNAVAPALTLAFSVLSVFFALRAIDAVIKRSWESLSLNYQ